MKTRRKVALWVGVALLGIVAGCFLLMNALMPETKLMVTVENRTDEPLQDGTYGYYGELSRANPPFDVVPARARVTGRLYQGPDMMQLHCRVAGAHDDTVAVGYPSDSGGEDLVWVVAEGESLVIDSTASIRHGKVSSAWSRRELRANR